MFDFEGHWFWIFFALLAIVAIIGKYKSRKLPPKQKALSELSFSITIFSLMALFLSFGFLTSGFPTYIPQKIDSLEEAQRILQEQNKILFNFIFSVYFLLLYLLVGLLPAIRDFAKAITPNDEEKTLNLNAEEQKPILGLNND